MALGVLVIFQVVWLEPPGKLSMVSPSSEPSPVQQPWAQRIAFREILGPIDVAFSVGLGF